MILFKNDWDNYPNAIIDYTTRNTSFIEYAALLKSMGIDNHAFCLALHNPLLKGVDPYAKNLDIKTILMITKESKENPWYFFREIVRVNAVGFSENIPLRANRGNISLFWLFFNHITTMLIQPRQTGKSVSSDSLMVWLFAIATIKTDMHLLTKDDNLRVKNIQRVKDLIASLPFYFNLKTKRDSNSTERLTLERLGNTYHTSVPQSSIKAAINLGRGMTLAINQIDEIPFIRNIKWTLPAMLAASGAARDMAKAARAPYGNLFTTTPGYLNSESGQFAYEIYKDCMKWTEKLFDSAGEEELREMIRRHSRGGKLQVLLEFNHRQLGFTDEWLREKIEDAMSSGEDAGADFLNIWAVGNETSPIPKDLLKKLQESIIPDPYTEITKYGYIIRWYVKNYELEMNINTRKIILSIDPSDAIGNDDIALIFRDATTGEVIGAGVYNETNVIKFSDWIADLIIKYDNITVVIERRSTGTSIIDNLLRILPLRGIDPFKRLFNWVTNDCDTNPTYMKEVIGVPMNRRDPIVYDKYRREFGYATSGSGRASRDNLYGSGFNASIKYTAGSVRDKTLIDQLSGLVYRNGRIDHGANGHDDMVIAWLLGYWFLTEAKNKHIYGLSPHMVLASVHNAIMDEEGGREVVLRKNRQMKLRSEIEALSELLKREVDPMKSTLLVAKIRHIFKDIDNSLDEVFDIDSHLANISLEKRKNNMYQNYAA